MRNVIENKLNRIMTKEMDFITQAGGKMKRKKVGDIRDE